MPLLGLPEPIGWRGGRTFLAAAIVVSLLMAAFFIALGVAALLRGSYLTAVVTLGAALSLLPIVLALLLAAAGRTELNTTSDATGFTLWPDRRFSILTITGVVLFLPGGVALAVLAPVGAIDIAEINWMRTALPVGAAFAVISIVTALIAGWRRGEVGHLKLTPAMIENADIVKTRTWEWDDIVDVADHAQSRKARRAVVLRVQDGHEEIITIADIYVPTGVPLYWMIRHYWKHPEDRMELVDSRALERLREGRFALD